MGDFIREEQIRPKNLFQKYLTLCQSDIKIYFQNKWQDMECPTCGNIASYQFIKSGFTYVNCWNCKNLFASPRPDFKSFETYYTSSDSANYWSSEFLPEVEQQRIKFVWAPKATEVLKIISTYRLDDQVEFIIDIGGSKGLFLKEFIKLKPKIRAINIEPNIAATSNISDIAVIPKNLEQVINDEMPEGNKIFTCFELFEHVHNPKIFLNHVSELMSSQDLLILSTLNSKGLDIKILWDNSPSINPPFHINFFNLESMKKLGEMVNLKTLKAYTPGKLDMDILMNNQQNINNIVIRKTLKFMGSFGRYLFQKVISKINQSSHMWIVYVKV